MWGGGGGGAAVAARFVTLARCATLARFVSPHERVTNRALLYV